MGDKSTIFDKKPPCDLCPTDSGKKAYADARLQKGPGRGSWAYVCRDCFKECGCALGLGFGQVIRLRPKAKRA